MCVDYENVPVMFHGHSQKAWENHPRASSLPPPLPPRDVYIVPEQLPPPLPPRHCNYITNHTPHFIQAEKNGKIHFLHHKLLECDSRGGQYTIKDHDITVRIPEGAVPAGREIHFEIAVAMYGPFKFLNNSQPISPILWLCLDDDNSLLSKPFQVILPHFLPDLTKEKASYHRVVFAKANHTDHTLEDGQMTYKFQPCDIKPRFASCKGRSFGILTTNHCCFFCLQAHQTRELAIEAGYCLARIETFISQQRSEIHFAAVYCLPTCLKVSHAKHNNIIGKDDKLSLV